MKYIIYIFLIVTLIACKKSDDTEPTTPSNLKYAIVNVSVQTIHGILPETEIYVYKTAADRFNNKNLIASGVTNSSGMANIKYVVSPDDSSYTHYFKALHSSQGLRFKDFHTPPESVSNVFIDF